MRLVILQTILISFLLSFAQADCTLDPESSSSESIIHRDVAVIGGGSSGVYTSIRLQDYNKSVIIIEKNDYLGGHAETYTDPQTGIPINLGVVVFPNNSIVTNYFGRFDVPLGPQSQSSTLVRKDVDFSTGLSVNYTSPTAAELGAALEAYTTQLDKYLPLQQGFNLTYPVASDLLLPFGTFVAKYNLSSLLDVTFHDNQGFVPLLNISTIYMLKYLNVGEVTSLETGFLTTVHHNTGELYSKITTHLGQNLLLSSNVSAMHRSSSSRGIRLAVSTPSGCRLIRAKYLLSAIPPLLSSLTNFDLSPNETALFSQFSANGYYAGVLNNTGLPNNTIFSGFASAAPYNLPPDAGLYILTPAAAPPLWQVFYGDPAPRPDAAVQADIIADVKRLAAVQGYTGAGEAEEEMEFVAWTNHSPFNLMVGNEAIQGGFYERLLALNGQMRTFWNGAAWQSQDSAAIWEYTEGYLLPRILGAF